LVIPFFPARIGVAPTILLQKKIMLEHAFKYAVHFHIGALNIRSQKAIEKLGAKKIGEVEMEYFSELTALNYIYQIKNKKYDHRKS